MYCAVFSLALSINNGIFKCAMSITSSYSQTPHVQTTFFFYMDVLQANWTEQMGITPQLLSRYATGLCAKPAALYTLSLLTVP